VIDLNDMYLFAKVVESGGYSAAGRALGIQTSLLSRRVAELERELGVRLLNRTTRRISLTDVGRTFYEHCQALVSQADLAVDAVEHTRSEPRGLVRISCPVPLLHSSVMPMVSQFLASYPDVRVRVEATNRRVDVVEEGFDIALRVRTPPLEDTELVIRHLSTSESVLLGSPGLLARHGRPAAFEDLASFPTLSMTTAGERHTWYFTGPDGAAHEFAHLPRLISDDMATLHHAARQDLGIVCLPSFMVEADLRRGALVHLLPTFLLRKGIVHAVFASRRGMVPAVRYLIDALVAGFEKNPNL